MFRWEKHIAALRPCENYFLLLWLHTSQIISCIHGHNVVDEYPIGQLIEYTNNEESLLLKDGVVKVGFVGQWNILLMKGKTLVK
jgi:hypothetical protein